ncbi:hypothetical protein ACLKMH_19475 [Psychromonas sp. KJ10-10]|uniref:hypothetical protein n=1 Tax=Psychromonas sp. KJ10-10 TaxID=3391823 RepID=UPI0039B69BC4
MILIRHYYIAILGATLIHLAVLFLLSYSVEGGAKDKGEQGIEIDLGMLGDLGKATETQESSITPVEGKVEDKVKDEVEEVDVVKPQETVQEKKPVEQEVIEKAPVVEEVEPVIEPVIEEIVETKQIAEIKVKKIPVKKAEIKKQRLSQ